MLLPAGVQLVGVLCMCLCVVLLTPSREDTVDVHTERKTIVIPSRNPPKPPAADSVHDVSSTDDGSKVTYHPSETFRLVQEQDSGVVQSNVSPLTGVEIKTNQSKKLMMLDHVLQ